MIFAAITAAVGWFKSMPRGALIAAGVALACLALLTLHKCSVRSAVNADRAKTAAKAQETARGADTAARAKTDATRTTIEQGNEDARNAADGSSDPLKSALDNLRTSK